MLSDLEIARLQRAFADDPDLESDLVAMLDRLSAGRRISFFRQLASELHRSERAGTAVLATIGAMARTAMDERQARRRR